MKKKLIVFIQILAILGPSAPSSSFAASSAAVTVSSTPGATLRTQLSTNNVWSGMLDQTSGGQTKLNTLAAPYVRLHIGDDGYPAAMPEINYNQWSFSALDALVNNVFASGQQPLMNIKFAPDWMWSCYPNSIGVTNTQTAGHVVDLTFQTFAQYMARLVNYYNKGSMTTETGTVITNPAGTSHRIVYWELWNEPDLNNETPCAPSTGNGVTPSQYVTMWNAVTAAMLQADPQLKFVGPATAGSQFGSSTTTGNQYVDLLMSGSSTKPAALSFHGYGYWDNTVTDQWILDGDNSDPTNSCCGGVPDLVHGVNTIHSSYPSEPLWLTEVNVNADRGNDSYKRPWSELAVAWWGAAFQQTAPLGTGMIHQYDLVDGPQFGLIDDTTGNPYIAYYVIQLLDQAFPPGSILLPTNSSVANVLSLAVQKPNGHISVIVVNRQLASSTVKSSCGTGGVATTVTVSLGGITPSAISLQQLDKNNVNCSTNFAIAPTTINLSPSMPVTLNFPGYGLAVLDITTTGTGTDTTPPSVPTNLAATPVSSTTIHLSWTASTDNTGGSGLAGYGIFRGGVWISSVTTNSYQNTGLTPSTLYSYAVNAYDTAGNVSNKTNPISTTTLPAPSGGSITLTKSASPMTAVSGSTVTFTISYSNPTSGNATNGVITDVIPTGSTLVAGSITGGGTLSSGNTITWNLGTVSAGGAGSVSFQARVN